MSKVIINLLTATHEPQCVNIEISASGRSWSQGDFSAKEISLLIFESIEGKSVDNSD